MKLKIDNFMKTMLMLLFFVAFSSTTFAQRTVSGTVTEAGSNEPLIGASVLVVGTSAGTVTDIDGSYSVAVPDGATELEISYTGYGTQTIAIGASNVVDCALSVGTILDEVVVVGYGAVRKTDATGAVASVTEKDFNKGVITSPEQLIQGRTSGVQITSSSGEPGAGINVRVRGTSSVRNGNNPLFVVDGVPLSGGSISGAVQAGGSDSGFGSSSPRNPLNFLNPNDIASIDILKDASATAIYGSRGANGVIIITTKSGTANAGSIDYGYSIGTASISKKYDLLSASEFADANPTQDQGGNVDWQDELFRNALIHNHNLSYGNGNDRGDYRFSVSLLDQEGIIKNSGINRLSARFNGNSKFFNDKLKIGTQFSVANTKDDNVPVTDNSGFEGDLLAAALKSNPTMPIMDENDIDGDGITDEFTQPSITEPNPAAILEYTKDFTNTIRVLGNLSGEYSFTDELSFKTVLGFDRSFSNRKSAFSSDLVANGIVDRGRLFLNGTEINNRLWENYFTYNTEFGNNIDFTGLVGYSYQSFDFSAQNFEFTNFRTNDLDLMINNFASADIAGGNALVGSNSQREKDELQSYFARVNLGFNDKYLITASVRADGSTRFGSGNKYGVFPSFAAKWRLIQEDFIPDAFDDLGLRVGWGVTGNQEIPHHLYNARERFENWDIDNGGSLQGGGLDQIGNPNPNLQWESTDQINVGLDFAFLNYRLSGSVDLYRKNTNDLLFLIPAAQPAISPFTWENLDANVINQGVELGLNGVIADNDGFSWNTNFNISYNDNIVENLVGTYDTGGINGQGLTGAFVQRIASGQPLYAFYVRDFAGYDDNGQSIYLDEEGNPGGDFQQFVGASPLPKWNLGLTNTMNFGDLDFSFFFTGQFGHYVYSNTANAFFTQGALANGRNVTSNVVGNGEGGLNNPAVSTRFLEKADFLRLQNVSLGYNLSPDSNIFRSVRLYLTGQNLAVFTNYSGQDPEVDTNKSLNGIPSAGIDYTPYPRARTFTLGVNLSFK